MKTKGYTALFTGIQRQSVENEMREVAGAAGAAGAGEAEPIEGTYTEYVNTHTRKLIESIRDPRVKELALQAFNLVYGNEESGGESE